MMESYFAHLPNGMSEYKRNDIKLVSNEYCPHRKKYCKAKSDGPCCLGSIKDCTDCKCPNNEDATKT